MALFTVGAEVNHRIGDPKCPECCRNMPSRVAAEA